jgi:hypothetical protein
MFFMRKEMFVIYLLSVFRFSFVQAMITKFETISSRKLPLAMQIISRDKNLISLSDYGNQYRMLKKLLVNHLLNPGNHSFILKFHQLVHMYSSTIKFCWLCVFGLLAQNILHEFMQCVAETKRIHRRKCSFLHV